MLSHTLHPILTQSLWLDGFIFLAVLLAFYLFGTGSTRQLRMRLQHDGAQREKERHAKLYEKVYLKVTHEQSKANSYLATLPLSALEQANPPEKLQDFFAAAAVLQVIASPKTAIMIGHIATAYKELSLKLLADLLRIRKSQQELNLHESLYVSHTEAKLQGAPEPSMTDKYGTIKLGTSAQEQLQRTQEAKESALFANLNALRTHHAHLNIEFCCNLLIELKRIVALQAPLILQIRQEMGLREDAELLKAQLEEQWKRLIRQVENTITVLRKHGIAIHEEPPLR